MGKPMINLSRLALLILLTLAAKTEAKPGSPWQAAEKNSQASQECFTRCHRLVEAWLRHQDAETALLPQNLQSPLWTPENSAADLWPFFVLTAYFTDESLFQGILRQTLRDEIAYTTRLDRLPDAFSLESHSFARPSVSLPAVLFGASEYAKDGLLPLVEVMGRTVWFHRLREILDDIFKNAPVATDFGPIPSDSTEVNGEMLQSLARLFFATGDRRYLAWAERIGEAYFLEMLPRNNGLPAHQWDFTNHRPISDLLSLNDHGNEIVGGLSELLVAVTYADPPKAEAYREPMRRMLDTLLDHARNEDGLWFGLIRPSTLEVQNRGTPDTWGYALNAVYTFYLLTGEEKYRSAVAQALSNLNQEKYLNWGGADAFADSIESGIVLLNRLPVPEGLAWLEAIVPTFLAKQREDGIVEGWHGDGNYARTALMVALYKTQGVFVRPWRADVRLGAARQGETLCLHLAADEAWEGRLIFDLPRHREHWNLPLNYPRLNEFPEWFTVEPTRLYQVETQVVSRPSASPLPRSPTPPLPHSVVEGVWLGDDLRQGFPVAVPAGASLRLRVSPYREPPYGPGSLELCGERIGVSRGAVDYRFTVQNRADRAQRVLLTTTWGRLSTNAVMVGAGRSREVKLTGHLKEDQTVHLTARGQLPFSQAGLTVELMCVEGLVDYVDCVSEESYQGIPYQWTGKGPIEHTLKAEPGKDHILELYWGSKGDQRTGTVFVDGRKHDLTHGGYQGFRWVSLEVPAEAVADGQVVVRIVADEVATGKAFVARMRLRLACPAASNAASF